MNSIFKIFTLVVTIFYWQNIYSQTLYVDSAIMFPGNGGSWSTAFANLGDALDSAHKNPAIDSILVAKGTYYPNHYPYDMNASQIGVEQSLTNTANMTFHIRVGLEVYGGYPNGGGARSISANPTILSGNNGANTFLHVVLIDSSTNWTTANDSSKIDGLIIEKGYTYGTVSLTVNGYNVSYVKGGGVYTNDGIILINKCIIKNNEASDNGAGISANNSNMQIIDCQINDNNPDGSYIINDSLGELLLLRTSVFNNLGYGVFVNSGIHYIYNNLVYNNSGFNSGAGIYLSGLTHYVVNNTFYSNQFLSNGGAGGLHFQGSVLSKLYLYNNIFWINSTGGSIDSSYSDIFATSGSITAKNNSFQHDSISIATLPLLAASANNLYETNPQFTGGTGANFYTLLPYSMLINKGDSSLHTGVEKLDILLNNRVQLANIDIGAIESNACQVLHTFNDSICIGNFVVFRGDSLYTTGTYIDTLLSSGGCDSVVTLHLFVFNIVTIPAIQHVKCFGDSSGSIGINVSGGVAPYMFSWNTGATTGAINNLKADTYYYAVMDALGCTRADTFEITQPSTAIGYAMSILNTSCYARSDGKIKLFVSGGVTPYIYAWSNSATADSIANVMAGNYTCNLTDANGCKVTVTSTVNEPNPIASAYNQSICSGSSYFFNGNNLTTAGTYHDTFTAANGCDSFVMLNLSVLPVAAKSIIVYECKGKSYLFNGVQQSTAGIYYDTFVSANGCDSIVTLYLGINPAPIITFQDSSDFTTAYTWRGNSYTSAGTYYDTSSAANKCDTIYKLVLTLDTTSTPSPIAKPLTITYSNDTLYASIDSATSYQWYLCGPPMKKITGANKRHFYTKDKSKYTVVVTKNGKTDTAACAPNSPSSIGVYSSYSGLSYFPNPVIHKLTIDLPDKYRNITLAISDIKGQKLWSKEYRELKNTTVDMGHFANGIYFLHINSESGLNEMIKLVKDGE